MTASIVAQVEPARGRRRDGRARRGSSSRRSAIVRRRMRSTSAKSSGPACSAMTWPSSAPSSRTSTASGSRAPAVPIPPGSAVDRRGRAIRRAGAHRAALAPRTVPRPSRHRDRNRSGRQPSVRLYGDGRDRRLDPRPRARTARQGDAGRTRVRDRHRTSSSSSGSCTRSPGWRRRPGPGTSCSRRSSTGPATRSTPTSPRSTCSIATERT